MAAKAIKPTGVEAPYTEDELIVTKTDLKGHITYANDVFLRLSKYPPDEVFGAPHSLIRHPSMPRCIFKLLWDTIQAKKEIFAYVINMAQNGDHYWVFAHVTPTLDASRTSSATTPTAASRTRPRSRRSSRSTGSCWPKRTGTTAARTECCAATTC